jgi:hypothetical protein
MSSEFFQIYSAILTTLVLLLLPIFKAALKFTTTLKNEIQRISFHFDDNSDVSKARGGSVTTILQRLDTTLNDVIRPEEMLHRISKLETDSISHSNQIDHLSREVEHLKRMLEAMQHG